MKVFHNLDPGSNLHHVEIYNPNLLQFNPIEFPGANKRTDGRTSHADHDIRGVDEKF